MNLKQNLECWAEIAGDIEGLIVKIEARIGSQEFSLVLDRHSLSKIDKKLYEALEIANKAYAAHEPNND